MFSLVFYLHIVKPLSVCLNISRVSLEGLRRRHFVLVFDITVFLESRLLIVDEAFAFKIVLLTAFLALII